MSTVNQPAQPVNTRTKFTACSMALQQYFVEREVEIALLQTAAICGHHVLFVGKPGTAKSALLRCFAAWCSGSYFEYVLHKFAEPDELFGPLSMSGLQNDEYRRLVTGYLPCAEMAFLDEIFKAGPAILNTILGVLNERIYRCGTQVLNCPLRLCVAGSNEFPSDGDNGGRELAAFFDRFLFRKQVNGIVSSEGRDRLLWGNVGETAFLNALMTGNWKATKEDLDIAREQAMSLTYSETAKQTFGEILDTLRRDGISPSERRIIWSRDAVKAYAWLHQADKVESDHLEVLCHTLWDDPNEQPGRVAEAVMRLANPLAMRVNTILVDAQEIRANVDFADMSKAAVACSKLQHLFQSLDALGSDAARDGRVDAAKKYIKKMMTEIRRNVT